MLLIALYVRDASGLRPQVAPEIPQLEPAVPRIETPAMNSMASSQWADWWQLLLEGGGFWPDTKRPSDLSKLTDDPDVQRLFYWGWRYGPPNFEALSDAPELKDLVRRQFDAARVWSEERQGEFAAISSARQRGLLECDVVQAVEPAIGRAARPFSFDVRVLPVAGVQAWRLSSGRALVTRRLYRDRDAYRNWLRPIVEELA